MADDGHDSEVGDLASRLLIASSCASPVRPVVASLPTPMAEEEAWMSGSTTHVTENAVTSDYFVGASTDEDVSTGRIRHGQLKLQECMQAEAEIELSHEHFVISSV